MLGLLARLGTIPLLFLIVSFGIFLLVDLAPGDVALEVAGAEAPPEEVERVREALGLNDPVVVRYGSWLGGFVTGDLGNSLKSNRPVVEMIIAGLPATLSLALCAMIVALVVGGTLGILAAANKGGWIDRATAVFASVGIASPQFWLGLVVVTVFALQLGWFPATGFVPITEDPWEWLRRMILPTIALACLPAAEILRHTRSAALEVLDRPYILTARSKGMSNSRVISHHVLRNAAIPVVTVLGSRVAQLFAGAVVVETVFGIYGLGQLTVQGVLQRDMPVILGLVAFTTLVVLVINFLVDQSYSLIDPRARSAR